MVYQKTARDRVFDIFLYLFLILLAAVFLYPLIHIIMGSFSNPTALMRHTGLLLWPQGKPSLIGYKNVFSNNNVFIGYCNTIFIVLIGTIINLLMTVLAAYVLSRRNLMHKRLLSMIVIFTMYVNAGLVPNFLLVQKLGLVNNMFSLILPGTISTWNMIVLRTAFNQVPRSLEESAMIDGANDLVILFRIILPVAKATIAVVILFYAVGHWNSWFSAFIYIRDRDKYPLQLFLREILIRNSAQAQDPGEMGYVLETLVRYCTIIVSTLPVLFVYPFAQKHFVSGIMMGSLKE